MESPSPPSAQRANASDPTPLIALVLCVTIGASAHAQDAFEIQVYEYETVPRGRWDLETHVNYAAHGIRDVQDGVAPSQRQTHLTFELTRGITNYFEMVLRDRGLPRGGPARWRARRDRQLALAAALPAARDWLPFKFSLSTEFGFPKRIYEENSITFELRPILEKDFGKLQVDLNPVLGNAIRGPGSSEFWDFEPGVRLGYLTSKVLDLSLQYYGASGPLNRVEPGPQQMHQLFPGADINFSNDVVLNVGVCFGLTSAGNTLVYKTRLRWIF